MDLFCLMKVSPAAGPLDGGSWRWCFRSGARTLQEDRKKGKTPEQPILTSLECSVERKRLQAAQPPRVARRCTSSLGHTARRAKNQNIRAEKYLRKHPAPQPEWNRSRVNEVADLRVHSQLLSDESLSNFPSQPCARSIRTMILNCCCVRESCGLFFL